MYSPGNLHHLSVFCPIVCSYFSGLSLQISGDQDAAKCQFRTAGKVRANQLAKVKDSLANGAVSWLVKGVFRTADRFGGLLDGCQRIQTVCSCVQISLDLGKVMMVAVGNAAPEWLRVEVGGVLVPCLLRHIYGSALRARTGTDTKLLGF